MRQYKSQLYKVSLIIISISSYIIIKSYIIIYNGVIDMVTLSTGLVIAGAYADKLRRTLFAQLSDKVKSGELDSKEVARAAAEVNQLLFNILVEDLKIEKGDVVRIRIDYDVKDGEIKWDLSTLSVEAFKRLEDEKVAEVVKKRVEELSK